MAYMAKFTGFDDTCDMSAVLGILTSASVFTPDVKNCANDVQKKVRNPSAHVNFKEWDDAKFKKSFELMKLLVKALALPTDEENQITDELGEWRTKGMDLFVRGNVLDVIEMSQEQITCLLKEVQKENAEQATKALQSFQKALENVREDIFNKFKGLKQQVDRHAEEIRSLKLASQNK